MTATPPQWLLEMADRVAAHIHPMDVLAPLGCHYSHNADLDEWEVALFVSASETVGGRRDGQVTFSRFVLDLPGVFRLFSDVETCSWQNLPAGKEDELGCHLSIEGAYAQHNVWLRVLAVPPPRFEVGRFIEVDRTGLTDRW